MDDDSCNKFIGSLTKYLQSLCHSYVNFEDGVELVGHIYLNVDTSKNGGEKKIDYVLHESVCKNGANVVKFTSNSYHAQPVEKKDKKDLPKKTPDPPKSKAEPPKKRDDDDVIIVGSEASKRRRASTGTSHVATGSSQQQSGGVASGQQGGTSQGGIFRHPRGPNLRMTVPGPPAARPSGFPYQPRQRLTNSQQPRNYMNVGAGYAPRFRPSHYQPRGTHPVGGRAPPPVSTAASTMKDLVSGPSGKTGPPGLLPPYHPRQSVPHPMQQTPHMQAPASHSQRFVDPYPHSTHALRLPANMGVPLSVRPPTCMAVPASTTVSSHSSMTVAKGEPVSTASCLNPGQQLPSSQQSIASSPAMMLPSKAVPSFLLKTQPSVMSTVPGSLPPPLTSHTIFDSGPVMSSSPDLPSSGQQIRDMGRSTLAAGTSMGVDSLTLAGISGVPKSGVPFTSQTNSSSLDPSAGKIALASGADFNPLSLSNKPSNNQLYSQVSGSSHPSPGGNLNPFSSASSSNLPYPTMSLSNNLPYPPVSDRHLSYPSPSGNNGSNHLFPSGSESSLPFPPGGGSSLPFLPGSGSVLPFPPVSSTSSSALHPSGSGNSLPLPQPYPPVRDSIPFPHAQDSSFPFLPASDSEFPYPPISGSNLPFPTFSDGSLPFPSVSGSSLPFPPAAPLGASSEPIVNSHLQTSAPSSSVRQTDNMFDLLGQHPPEEQPHTKTCAQEPSLSSQFSSSLNQPAPFPQDSGGPEGDGFSALVSELKALNEPLEDRPSPDIQSASSLPAETPPHTGDSSLSGEGCPANTDTAGKNMNNHLGTTFENESQVNESVGTVPAGTPGGDRVTESATSDTSEMFLAPYGIGGPQNATQGSVEELRKRSGSASSHSHGTPSPSPGSIAGPESVAAETKPSAHPASDYDSGCDSASTSTGERLASPQGHPLSSVHPQLKSLTIPLVPIDSPSASGRIYVKQERTSGDSVESEPVKSSFSETDWIKPEPDWGQDLSALNHSDDSTESNSEEDDPSYTPGRCTGNNEKGRTGAKRLRNTKISKGTRGKKRKVDDEESDGEPDRRESQRVAEKHEELPPPVESTEQTRDEEKDVSSYDPGMFLLLSTSSDAERCGRMRSTHVPAEVITPPKGKKEGTYVHTLVPAGNGLWRLPNDDQLSCQRVEPEDIIKTLDKVTVKIIAGKVLYKFDDM